MKTTMVPFVISALGTIPKCLVRRQKEIGGRAETIKTTAMLRSARILLET